MGKNEEWKVIQGFELYEVSNTGKVRVKDRMTKNGSGMYLKKGKELKPVNNGNGYLRIHLKQDGKTKKEYVHRLVANAFIPNPESKPFINHLDNNPLNNKVDNLEWCTPKENVEWMAKQKRNARTKQWLEHLHETQKKTYTAVVGENIATGETIFFPKLNDVRKAGFQPSCVCVCCKGKNGVTQHRGYKWKYEKQT